MHARTHLCTHLEGRARPSNSIETESQAECRRFLDLHLCVCASCFAQVAAALLLSQAVSTTATGHKTQQPHLHGWAAWVTHIRSCPISYEGKVETPTVFSEFLSNGEPSKLVLMSRSGDDGVSRNDATRVNNDSYVTCHVSLTFIAKCILYNVYNNSNDIFALIGGQVTLFTTSLFTLSLQFKKTILLY